MNNSDFIKSIQISDFSSTPKYLQLADAVIEGVRDNRLKLGDILPSINELSVYLDISRDTVEKGYKHLKNLDIISSTPGKGYFVAKSDVVNKQKIALFLNKLSAHKKIVYDAFARELGDEASLDLFVYNSDISHLRSLLLNLTKQYDRYVVFPHFKEGRDQAPEVLALIPADKLMLLGRMIEGVKGTFDAVYENYEKDIYEALEKALEPLARYRTLKLIFPDNSDYPKAIIKGFYKFCQQYAFDHILVGDLSKESIRKGECYINLAEDDLVLLLEKCIAKEFVVGQDVGIISYNETPLKKFILNGITTISTDFELMGKYAAQIIKGNGQKQVEVPFYINIRSSI
ncbi:DNA-binding transcriptional regulator YhcF (GntR family) [Sphingobacterium allocomposti]|jgi:DNA-binding transcriptional regulator YhcF (GntR family)|uniref:DNA-binding transcriptional regulator YhcF (GntR family) n=1 Tax=Sphingobacterium allocomposti TaxID=415956 RepID=A0A5S5DR33_9SPHI|nr:GntR family transcriptional regulator [Sphingobacterium composti Yoo et al. 2007 non Ten et al. 2007]TYP98413.1 DNA-binding transcriptional regulator YhcF (GntR family) [Sphingobacterium composti Yoo et al. 2007 non Ten et al. 2007]HLS96790.1 GntR family transcriptional regulator [Sphingobacterium sp.]